MYLKKLGNECRCTLLDAVREKTVHGDRQVYHTITDVRSTIIVFLSLY